MPAKSQAQRAYLNSKFGHAWVKAHHFDNRGKLPAHVRGKKVSKHKGHGGGHHLSAPMLGHGGGGHHVGPKTAHTVGHHHKHNRPHKPAFGGTAGKSGGGPKKMGKGGSKKTCY